MREENSDKPITTWAIVLALVVVGLVLYLGGFGPMFWLATDAKNQVHNTGTGKVFLVVYEPVIRLYQDGPLPIQALLRRYLECWEHT